MFHPTFDPKGMNDQDLESKINDVTIKINQAKRMNHLELDIPILQSEFQTTLHFHAQRLSIEFHFQ